MAQKKTTKKAPSPKPQAPSQNPIRILTFTPVWQRMDIFEICLKGLKRLKAYAPDRFEIQPFFMVSESAAADLVTKYGFDFIMVQNNPLGAKKNAGLDYVLNNYEFDYLLEIGSDDLIVNEYLDLIEPLLKSEVPQLHPNKVWFACTLTGATAQYETTKIIGAGRCLAKSLLQQAVKREPFWNPTGSRGMDTYSWRNILKLKIGSTPVNVDKPMIIDIKSKVNINPMQNFGHCALTFDELIKHFPEASAIKKLLPKPEKVE